ncbi:MAG: hypothetical protein LIP01_00035 [Tannerellaceae bacterium]|nr:hypothetical protein [Tannerellaceae bacterium]
MGRFYDATGENIIISHHDAEIVSEANAHVRPYMQGPYEEYYSAGKMRLKGQYEKREKVGTWTYYHPDGTLEKEEEYVKDKVHTYRFFHPNNQPAVEFMLKGGWLIKEHVRYSEEGALVYRRIQDEQDSEKMHETFYYPDGTVKAVYTIRSRMRTGDYICYDEDGLIVESGEIEKDEYTRRVFYDKEGNVIQ